MTPTTWLLAFVIGWFALGAAQAMYLGRRVFDGVSWFLIGVVLGPLSSVLAWRCVRRDERLDPKVVRSGRAGHGTIDVLVGFDGSLESRGAIASVQRTFGDRLRRVALVSVLHFDDPPVHEQAKRLELDAAGRAFGDLHPELLIVRGHPATALAQEAQAGRFDLLAIGATGQGHAHVFGSAAKELIQHSPVPVLVVGQRVAAPAPAGTR